MDVNEFSEGFQQVAAEVSRVLVGQRQAVEQVLVALLARGHVLIEGVPGLGKTLLVRTLSQVMGTSFKRVQFTPDLMPTDVTGGNVYDANASRFVFNEGPIFTQLLLADEINRAPAKTQSALLEAMQEGAVTADGVTRQLPNPFFVIATQNPVESQGTYPLPEAQLDRFLLKLQIAYPSPESEKQILLNYVDGFEATDLATAQLRCVLEVERLRAMIEWPRRVRVDGSIIDYVTDIVGRTRAHPSIYLGASPRASLGMLACARAWAASQRRDFVIPDDVKSFAPVVLRHRLILHPDAELEGVTPDHCVDAVLREAPVPKGAA